MYNSEVGAIQLAKFALKISWRLFTVVPPTWHSNFTQVGTKGGAQVGAKLGYREPPY